jgi:hypothetical protein
MRFRLLISSLLALAATAAQALPLDPLGDPGQFQRDIEAINSRPLPDGEALARAVGEAVAFDARMRGRCQAKKLRIGPLAPVTLDGLVTGLIVAGKIENGWITSVVLEDCPAGDPIRILLLRDADGTTLQGIFAGQGDTLAWPTLAREALRATVAMAVQRLKAEDPACAPKDLTPTSVRITGTSPDLGPDQYGIRLKGSWSELWTFEPCGHRLSIPIAFRTNGSGGAYWDLDPGGVLYVR